MSVGSDWNSNPTHQYATGERPSIDILAICRHRKWTIVFFTLLAVGLGYLYYTKAPPIYETSAQVLIIKRRGEAQSPVALLQSDLGYEDSMTTHAQVIKSPEIVRRAVNNPEFHLPQLETFKDIPLEHLHTIIIADLTAGRAGGRDAPDSQVLQVNYRSANSLDAKQVVKAVLKSYEDFLGETYQDISNETISLITEAKDEVGKNLKTQNKEIAEYEKEVPSEVTLYFDQGMTKADEELKSLYTEEAKRQGRKLEVSTLLQTVESGKQAGKTAEVLLKLVESNSRFKDTSGGLEPQAMSDVMFPYLLEHKEMLAKYGAKHPRVQAVESKIQALSDHMESMKLNSEQSAARQRAEPEQLLSDTIETLRLELDLLETEGKGLQEAIDKTKKESSFLNGYALELKRRRQDRKDTEELFTQIKNKFEQMNLVKNRGGFDTRTIWPAEDVWQVEPKLVKCLAVGGLSGFLVGLAIACLIDLSDKSFRNADQVRQELGTSLMGHIPVIPEIKRSNRKKTQIGISESVITHHKPRSTIAEAYRAIRTSLNFGVRGEGHKVVQVTSPDPGDGKSTFSANLAVSLAQSGKSILLVDADFRRPRVAKIFGIDSSLGLSGYIQGTAELQDCVTTCGVENLTLLPCGPRPVNPAELLGSQQFRDFIETVRERYDMVIVDTPPVLAVTDPCVVAPRVDGVVLLIRITKDVRPHARRTVESLQELGANLLGVVVNGVGGVRPGTGHVFSSQYGHRYAYESGYYDSNAYDYDAYHHYYTDEEEAADGRPARGSVEHEV